MAHILIRKVDFIIRNLTALLFCIGSMRHKRIFKPFGSRPGERERETLNALFLIRLFNLFYFLLFLLLPLHLSGTRFPPCAFAL